MKPASSFNTELMLLPKKSPINISQVPVPQKKFEADNRKEIKSIGQALEESNSGRKSATPQRQIR